MTTPTAQGLREGEARKRAALALLEAHRTRWVRLARRALISALMDWGAATADAVHERIGELPADIDRRWLGSVPGPLARAGLIRPVSYTKSSRPSRHAAITTVWALATDHATARAWLDSNPELPEPPSPDDGRLEIPQQAPGREGGR